MKKLLFAIFVALAATASLATQRPDHCKPEPKPRDPPVVSRPDPAPKTPSQSRESGSRDQQNLCTRYPTLWICPKP